MADIMAALFGAAQASGSSNNQRSGGVGSEFTSFLMHAIETAHRRAKLVAFRQHPPPDATPLGSFVRILEKPADATDDGGPHWARCMDRYVGTIGQVLGGASENADWLTVALVAPDNSTSSEAVYRLSWVTPVEAHTVPPMRQRVLAEIEALVGRRLVGDAINTRPRQSAEWPAGTLVKCIGGTDRPGLVIGIDGNDASKLIVVCASPVVWIGSVAIASLRLVRGVEFTTMMAPLHHVALTELHGYMKHKHTKQRIRPHMPFPLDFAPLPRAEEAALQQPAAAAAAATESKPKKRRTSE
jgi:hypothetical protein